MPCCRWIWFLNALHWSLPMEQMIVSVVIFYGSQPKPSTFPWIVPECIHLYRIQSIPELIWVGLFIGGILAVDQVGWSGDCSRNDPWTNHAQRSSFHRLFAISCPATGDNLLLTSRIRSEQMLSLVELYFTGATKYHPLLQPLRSSLGARFSPLPSHRFFQLCRTSWV